MKKKVFFRQENFVIGPFSIRTRHRVVTSQNLKVFYVKFIKQFITASQRRSNLYTSSTFALRHGESTTMWHQQSYVYVQHVIKLSKYQHAGFENLKTALMYFNFSSIMVIFRVTAALLRNFWLYFHSSFVCFRSGMTTVEKGLGSGRRATTAIGTACGTLSDWHQVW